MVLFLFFSANAANASGPSRTKCVLNGQLMTVKKVIYKCFISKSKKTWQIVENREKPSKIPSTQKKSIQGSEKTPDQVVNTADAPGSKNENSVTGISENVKEVKFPSVELSSENLFLDTQRCKINNASSQTDVHQGFNQGKFVLSTKKVIRAVIVPIDFPDLVGSGDPVNDFQFVPERVNGYYSAISDGKIKFSWEIRPTFLRFPEKVSEIRLGGKDTSGFYDFSVRAKSLAKDILNFKNFDLLVFAPPLSTTRMQIAFGPAFLSFSENDINATMLDGQMYELRGSSGAFSTAHEIGHLMGLADLYNFNALADAGVQSPNDPAFLVAQHKFMGTFDLMNNVGGSGLELTAWNRWLIGAIEDNQMRCLPKISTTTFLSSLSIEGGIKGAVIPVSSNEVVVIESRKPLRYDLRIGTPGVLVYKVDTSIKSGYGPVSMIRKTGSSNPLGLDALLGPGESIAYGDFQIQVIETGKDGDVVEVKYVAK